MKLIKRKVSSVEELKNKLSTELEIFGNKNCLSSFDENTENDSVLKLLSCRKL